MMSSSEADAGQSFTLHVDEDGSWCDDRGLVFIPEDANPLQSRLLVIAHAGAAGHRGQEVTLNALRAKFVWLNMAEICANLCNDIFYAARRVPGV